LSQKNNGSRIIRIRYRENADLHRFFFMLCFFVSRRLSRFYSHVLSFLSKEQTLLASTSLSLTIVSFKHKKTAEFPQQFSLFSIFFILYSSPEIYTLKRKCITSPSFTIYSFPSTLNFPASFAFASEPYCT
jgi:hypothetical protein